MESTDGLPLTRHAESLTRKPTPHGLSMSTEKADADAAAEGTTWRAAMVKRQAEVARRPPITHEGLGAVRAFVS